MTRQINVAALRRSGRILTQALAHVVGLVRPGVATKDLDREGEAFIRDHGGIPAFLGHMGFSGSLCTSVNHQIVHGVPGKLTLQEGDIISLDGGVKIDGWYTDAAVTVGVGEISETASRLLDVTSQSLKIALKEARTGRTTGDLGAAVQRFVEGHDLGIVRGLSGHGIGQKLHEPPHIPNHGNPGEGDTFRAGMVIAVEPMVVQGSPEIEIDDDQWTVFARDHSLAAHFEETVIVGDDQPERLTPLEDVLSGVTDGGRVGKVA